MSRRVFAIRESSRWELIRSDHSLAAESERDKQDYRVLIPTTGKEAEIPGSEEPDRISRHSHGVQHAGNVDYRRAGVDPGGAGLARWIEDGEHAAGVP